MSPLRSSLAAILLGLLGATVPGGAEPRPASRPPSRTVHDFTANTIDGTERPLADYKGKVLLIVNTASKCGFTPQYESLQTLYERYRDRGFEILAFPSNDFMGQEPGSNAEIKTFCTVRYNTDFPLFAKIRVKGKEIHPLYAYLTKESKSRGTVSWNFTKFLVGPDGRVAARFGSSTDPLSREIAEKIESLLPARP